MPQILLSFTKWLLIRAPSHSWVPVERSSPGMDSYTHLFISAKLTIFIGFHTAYMDFLKPQTHHYCSWCSMQGFLGAIRCPNARHPVFTGKPLNPGLMHSKHTTLCKCGWWLSDPFFYSLLCFSRHQWPFKRGQAANMRGALLDWAALNWELRWRLSVFIAAQQSCCSVRLDSVTSSSAEGQMGSLQTSSQEADIPFLVVLCLFERVIVLHVLAIVKTEIGFKVKIRGVSCFK